MVGEDGGIISLSTWKNDPRHFFFMPPLPLRDSSLVSLLVVYPLLSAGNPVNNRGEAHFFHSFPIDQSTLQRPPNSATYGAKLAAELI